MATGTQPQGLLEGVAADQGEAFSHPVFPRPGPGDCGVTSVPSELCEYGTRPWEDSVEARF